ncbi:MAG: hypothetical protein RLZZ58_1500 [Pseudomonadota bacterium]
MSFTPPANRPIRATVSADDDGIRLDRWVKRHHAGLPHALLSRWARSGDVLIDGKRANVSDRIAAGQKITMPSPPTPVEPRAEGARGKLSDEDARFARDMVIHRDGAAIVINKPPGLATQGGTGTLVHVDGLLDALAYDLTLRPKLVHRLDKDTSGALLLARSAKSAAYFAKSFSSRTARKTYWAIVMGVPDIAQGEIDLPINKQPGSGGEKMHVDLENGLPARTRYRIIERAGNSAAWVELTPFSGRTHQLRVHMAAIGHPIVGDGKYGGKDAFLTGTISRKMHLHARRIRIDHPDGHTLDVTADLPAHFAESLNDIGFDLLLGDMRVDDDDGPAKPSRVEEKAAAKAHSKQVRKLRRGERRGRADAKTETADRPARKLPAKAKGKKPPAKTGDAPRAASKPRAAAAPPRAAPKPRAPARTGPPKTAGNARPKRRG